MAIRRGLIAAYLLGLFVFLGAASASDKPEDAAQAAAESWLKLVDAADYAGAWDKAAKVFKGSVKQADWSQMAAGVRTPLGKLVSRRLKSRQYAEKMPGAPDGRYVVIQYDTVFEHKASAVETVTDGRPRWSLARVGLLHSLNVRQTAERSNRELKLTNPAQAVELHS